MTYDVLVQGIISTDIIFSSIPKLPKPGEEVYCGSFEFTCGAAYNTAVALSRLGMKVAVISPIGNDFLSRFMKESLEAEGVSTSLMLEVDQPLRCLSVAINYGGDRSFLSYQDNVEKLNLADYAKMVIQKTDSKVLHTGAVSENISVIETAKKKGMYISLDVGWDEEWLTNPQLDELIKMADIFTPNQKEAETITGLLNPLEAIEKLNKYAAPVVIKLGEEGAIVRHKNATKKILGYKCSAVDTTGAGDVFSAGLLTGILKGWSLDDSVKLGNYCGSCSVQSLGGTTGSPTWQQVQQDFFEPSK
ncbi:carbohydrate kinase family protein [Fictibacillus sp. FJAT-27399]|uniref:carbohydrate kinase family protein n=1 Tax=Fictibacillus sp. FJAT-27399 TaxID=1729689 RepID=UPI0007840083|nr:carbohydrate kinase family protein [Fictibacillus sp. FJAT-27399]